MPRARGDFSFLASTIILSDITVDKFTLSSQPEDIKPGINNVTRSGHNKQSRAAECVLEEQYCYQQRDAILR